MNRASLGYNQNEMDSVAQLNAPAEMSESRRELAALIAGCAIYRPARVLFSITGRDRVRWLNGMVTNNIRDLAEGQGVYSFVLNSQGHILGDLYVFNHGENMFAEIESSQAETLLQILRRYIIMDKVEIAGLSEQAQIISLAGPKSSEVLAAAGLPADLTQLQLAEFDFGGTKLSMVRGDNPCVPDYEIWAPRQQIEAIWNSLTSAGAENVEARALEMFRILCGIPKVDQNIRERTLPSETEQERALNFNKCCYIGQEIVERVRSRGNVHRTFAGFEVEGPVPTAGTKIQSAAKDVGELTSIAPDPLRQKQVALGFIRKEALTNGQQLVAGEATLKPAKLPFTGIFQ